MLFVVVFLEMKFTVVYFLLLVIRLLLLLIGVLVLLIIITSYYANRGGRSSFGDGCGIFYIDLRTLSSNTGWISGAALECFILLYSTWRSS